MARGPRVGVRLSVEPLLTALNNYDIDPEQVEGRLNAAIRKAKFNGFFTLNTADEIACTVLSLHPYFIWGEEYESKVWHDMEPEDTEPMAVAA